MPIEFIKGDVAEILVKPTVKKADAMKKGHCGLCRT
jgi:hypothetical protein